MVNPNYEELERIIFENYIDKTSMLSKCTNDKLNVAKSTWNLQKCENLSLGFLNKSFDSLLTLNTLEPHIQLVLSEWKSLNESLMFDNVLNVDFQKIRDRIAQLESKIKDEKYSQRYILPYIESYLHSLALDTLSFHTGTLQKDLGIPFLQFKLQINAAITGLKENKANRIKDLGSLFASILEYFDVTFYT
jgi:hypothetical protein